MNAILVNKYDTISKKTGQVVRMYVYKITQATQDELEMFQLVQGVNYREDEGSPIFQTPVFEGENVRIVKSKRKDPKTGALTDSYKALGSEDFELKRVATAAPAVRTGIPTINRNAAANVTVTDANL